IRDFHVTGVQTCALPIYPRALQIASGNGKELDVFPRFIELHLPNPDLASLVGPCDTVVMNPPFGAQEPHADRPFIDAALSIAPEIGRASCRDRLSIYGVS